MPAIPVPGSRWGRRLLQGTALLVLSGLVGGLVSLASAQNARKAAAPKKAVPEEKAVTDILVAPSGQEQVAFINAEVEKKWQENKITPSPRCSEGVILFSC